MSLKRFFLDQDNSSHWYLIPTARRSMWVQWLSLSEDDENSWTAPTYAVRLDGGPTAVTFSQPETECE